MLQRLFIQNYAILERQEITFDSGLSIITGETGAGKSILLGAISLVLGQRADSKVLFDKEKKAIVEAEFADYPPALNAILADQSLDVDDRLILRREIQVSGKSRAFVNDTPVRLNTMQLISAHLIDMHKQFESLEIQDSALQYRVLDAYSEISTEIAEYQVTYQKHQELDKHIQKLMAARQKAMQERDYLQFQLDEFQSIELEDGLLEQWESDYHVQDNAAAIKTLLGTAGELLSGADGSVLEQLREVQNGLSSYSGQNSELQELLKRVQSLVVEIDDLGQQMYRHGETIDPDPALKAALEDKIDVVRRLMMKHGVQTDSELIQVREKVAGTLNEWEALNDDLEQAQADKEVVYTELLHRADSIHKTRSANAPKLSDQVTELLRTLEMKNARVEVDVASMDAPGPNGADEVQLFFTSNLGAQRQPIKKVASGGELSRVSLCIKSVVSQKMHLPTLIFDEIDTGVSGQVALKMGGLLKDLAKRHQVIMITHSPQIASRAQQHLMVRKRDTSERSIAEVMELNEQDRIQEIAKMLSGDPPTEAAVLNAKELINV